MPYNPNIHHRKSIRLKGYDYSQAGLYFVTICCQNRACLFGEIKNGKMILNNAGRMIEKWYYELENKFSDIRCDEMVIMPNHFHCIVENVGFVGAVGADLRVGPTTAVRADTQVRPYDLGEQNISPERQPILGEHVGSPLHRVVQWFKTMTTNEYIRGVKNLDWQRFDGKLWQRNYWEHIIRNDEECQRIANYIINNPLNWENDKLK